MRLRDPGRGSSEHGPHRSVIVRKCSTQALRDQQEDYGGTIAVRRLELAGAFSRGIAALRARWKAPPSAPLAMGRLCRDLAPPTDRSGFARRREGAVGAYPRAASSPCARRASLHAGRPHVREVCNQCATRCAFELPRRPQRHRQGRLGDRQADAGQPRAGDRASRNRRRIEPSAMRLIRSGWKPFEEVMGPRLE